MTLSLPDQLTEFNKACDGYQYKEGVNVYALSNKWFFKFTRAIKNYKNDSSTVFDIPIDNNHLLKDGNMKQFLRIPYDFRIIPKSAWDLVFSWYKGGPEISIPVLKNEDTGEVEPCYKHICFSIHKKQINKELIKNFLLPPYKTFKDLKLQACDEFQLNDSDKVRLINYYQSSPGDPIDEETKLSKCIIAFSQDLLIEVQNDDGSWPNYNPIVSRKLYAEFNPFAAPTYIDSSRPGKPGICGLRNLGNTCYMNAAIQCLVHTKPLIEYLSNGTWKEEINRENKLGTNGDIVEAFSSLLSKIMSGNREFINPYEFRKVFSKTHSFFASFDQHDSIEFINALLDSMHEDLKKNLTEVTNETVGDGTDDTQLYQQYLDNQKKIGTSKIKNMFSYVSHTTRKCTKCNFVSSMFDHPQYSMLLPIPNDQATINFLFIPFDREKELPKTYSIKVNSNSIEESIRTETNFSGKLIYGILYNDMFLFSKNPDPRHNMFVYEIPDETKSYALIRVYVKKKNNFDDEKITPFFVEYSENIEEAILDRISFLWEGKSRFHYVDVVEEEIQRNGVPFPSDNNSRIRVEQQPEMNCIPSIPFIMEYPIKVYLNPNEMKESKNFDWEALLTKQQNELPNVGTNAIQLKDCLDMYMREQVSDWICPGCKQTTKPSVQTCIWETSDILVIQLERFSKIGPNQIKNDKEIFYPDTLDLTQYAQGPGKDSAKYKLYGVIIHIGSMFGGHYIAVCHDNDNPNKWHLYDDDRVREVDQNGAHNGKAYILFYEKIGEKTGV